MFLIIYNFLNRYIFNNNLSGVSRESGWRLRSLGSALGALLLPLTAMAGEWPLPPVPDSVGINIHFVKGGEQDLDLIAAAGIKVVRTDLKWEDTERLRGVYDWTAYDELAANLAKRGLRPYFILDYSNALHEETVERRAMLLWSYTEVMSPHTPQSIDAFARWAAEAARHFRQYRPVWEIWNEPNIKFWKPKPDVDAYSQLALATCAAVRKADPDATVVAPAASGFPWDYLENFFKSGALSCLDGVSVHPYRNDLPESVGADYARLRQLVDRYAPPGKHGRLPILSGEWGYATVRNGLPLISQAAYLVRMQLINLSHGIPLSVWYDWKNDGGDAANHEHNFGIVDPVSQFKPAYIGLRTFTTQLRGYRYLRRVELDNGNDYALLFGTADGRGKLVAWTTGVAHVARIPAPPPPRPAQMSVTDGNGLRLPLALEGAWMNVQLTGSPVYIAP
ncbi:MAG: hypothetical protein E6R07_13000 [Nevskiaceae bacterium]|nr:MAG: hypothetical protein E6R07_13000 [Nevskiaceae bacterium]